MRGTHNATKSEDGGCRFIPACAGNASPSSKVALYNPVHPRVCGERREPGGADVCNPGSSPRVRGTHLNNNPPNLQARFIPACAGNANNNDASPHPDPVHPRVCGERMAGAEHIFTSIGSSPRVRGTHEWFTPAKYLDQFIPACAGNADDSSQCRPARSVHPRVCGERFSTIEGQAAFTGSSPRVRGTRYGCGFRALCRRFIPACAGNALRVWVPCSMSAVHPRVCGERVTGVGSVLYVGGSSPRVRGTRYGCGFRALCRRFIPACAGNALRVWVPCSMSAVHPRVCGERVTGVGSVLYVGGSSPRVRGTRYGCGFRALCRRFIPACAGNA